MTWFTKLTCCSEGSPEEVRTHLEVDGSRLYSRRNGRSWQCGEFEIPTLAELRELVRELSPEPRAMTVREVIADVQQLHADSTQANALFQVASQFNLLEMTGPEVTPEQGIGIYEWDRTQGPACAIAAGAGTTFRNYFAVVNGRVGQSADNQIDCLADVGKLLGNTDNRLWEMVNGYALPSTAGLQEIDQKLQTSDEAGHDELRQALRIGLHWDTQVTIADSDHVVSQAYCSALPVAYTRHSSRLWACFATLVLEASYEATLCAAIINAERTGNNKLFLTLLGGGAFGNELEWILSAIRRSLRLYHSSGLDVAIVSYGRSKSGVRELASEFA